MFNHRQLLQKQCGVAILMALVVVMLVTSLAIVWYLQNRMNIRRTTQLLISDQIYLYAEEVVDWAIGEIIIDANNTSSMNSHAWPKRLLPTPIANNQGVISGKMEHIDPYMSALPPHTPNHFSPASPIILRAFNLNKNISANEKSEYFLVQSNVKLANQYLMLSTLLFKKITNGKTEVGIIWQSRGNPIENI